VLIYLDTSHLVFLAEVRAASPRRFRAFLDAWQAADCTLALSLYHLIELRQHPDAGVRGQRYAALAELLPIRTYLNPQGSPDDQMTLLQDREVVLALLQKGHISVSGEHVEDWMRRYAIPFPHTLQSPVHLDTVRAAVESPMMGWIVRGMQSAHAKAAEALSRPLDQKHRPSPRLNNLPDAPISHTDLEQMMRIMEAGLNDPDFFRSLGPIVSPEQMKQSVEEAMGPIRQMMRRAGEVGPRAAYAELMGAGDPARDRRRLDRVGQESLLAERVRGVASSILGVDDPATVEAIASWIRVEDCPGTWLHNSLEAEIKRAEPQPDPGNAYDLEHSVHLPHVDVFTADKRIARYINQVLDRSFPPSLQGVGRPVAVPKDLDALRRAIIRGEP